MEVSKVDNKDGLRELIEMRNKRTKDSSTSATATTTTTTSSNKNNKSDYWLSTVKSLYDKSSTDPGPFSANNSNSDSSPVDEDNEERIVVPSEAQQEGNGTHSSHGDLPRLRLRVDGDRFTNLNTASTSLLAKNPTPKVQSESDQEDIAEHEEEEQMISDKKVKDELAIDDNNDADNNGDISDSAGDLDDVEFVQEGDQLPLVDDAKSVKTQDASDLPSQSSGDQPSDFDLANEPGINQAHPMDDDDMAYEDANLEEEQQTPSTSNAAIEEIQPPVDPNVWTLPKVKEDCTLEEIRRGQAINKKATNECPVMGCGKLINDARADPMPGTIAAGLRTHVLFVHYQANRLNKRRKLGWSKKRPSQPSPRKSMPTDRYNEFGLNDKLDYGLSNINDSALAFARRNVVGRYGNSSSHGSTSLINKSKPVRFPQEPQSSQPFPMSSLQSLIQATGGAQSSPHAQQQQLQQLNLHNQQQQQQAHQRNNNNNLDDSQKNLNNTTSSLFNILTSLTQQPPQQSNQTQQQQQPVSRIAKSANNSANTINISQCSRPSSNSSIINISNNNNNNNNNGNRGTNPSQSLPDGTPVNSSLLSLLNETISTLKTQNEKSVAGNVATTLQNQLNSVHKRQRQHNSSSPPNTASLFPSNNGNFSSLAALSGMSNGDPNFGLSMDSLGAADMGRVSGGGHNNRSASLLVDNNNNSLNSFIRTIAAKTDSNIGPDGLNEVKRLIEKFTNSLLCNSQTIVDHYASLEQCRSYGNTSFDTPQKKNEIKASDVQLAYKMMQKNQM